MQCDTPSIPSSFSTNLLLDYCLKILQNRFHFHEHLLEKHNYMASAIIYPMDDLNKQ